MSDIDIVLIARELIAECHEDEVGLWRIISVVRRHYPYLENSDTKALTLRVIKELLQSGIGAGQYCNPVFHWWEGSPDEIVARIEKEWNELGHEPTLGDVVWLTSRDEG